MRNSTAAKTRQLHATHLTTGDRLWSNMPFLRPLATIVEDTIAYGFDEDGAGVHDVIGSRCDPYTNHLLSGEHKTDCCHSNLTRQAFRDGLVEGDVHDVLNVFMCTGFTLDTHQYFTKPSPVEVGDYIEFLAETDLLVSASTCPQGDVSTACAGDGEPLCFPLGVEVWKPRDGLLEAAGWRLRGERVRGKARPVRVRDECDIRRIRCEEAPLTALCDAARAFNAINGCCRHHLISKARGRDTQLSVCQHDHNRSATIRAFLRWKDKRLRQCSGDAVHIKSR